jgi:hypothetical protein
MVWRGRRRRAVSLAIAGIGAAAAIGLTVAIMQGGDGAPRVVAPTPTATPGGPWVDLDLPPLDDRYVMRAAVEDSGGVAIDTEFFFTAKDGINKKDLTDRLRSVPAVEFDVEDGDNGQLRIVPRRPLTQGLVYRFTLQSEEGATLRNWAFQTQQPVRVVQTLPSDASTNVPLDTGIELTFSHDGVTGVEPLFSIEPAAPGRFEQHKRVWVFVPQQPLQAATIYTVTLRAGAVLSGSDDTVAADTVVRFETVPGPGSAPTFLGFTRRTFEMPTSEAPVLGLYGGGTGRASFSVFRFDGAAEFMSTLRDFDELPGWARASRDRYLVDTSTLDLAQTFEAEVQLAGAYSEGFVRFPAPMPEGFYLVEASKDGARAQGWLQVTDLAAYFALSDGRLLLWANDLRTQGPVSGATLRLSDGTDLGVTTGADGVALATPPDSLIEVEQSQYYINYGNVSHDLIVQAPDGRELVVPLGDVSYDYHGGGLRDYSFAGGNALYWRILQVERPLYLPTDTVRFFGFARPREGDARQLDLTARLYVDEYVDGYNQRSEPVAESSFTTSPSGAYTGELTFAGVPVGYHRLEVTEGEPSTGARGVVSTVYIEIRDYVKPAYQIDVTPSRRAVVAGETVDFDVQASFFDGSPLPQATLGWNYREGGGVGDLVTDAAGRARVSVTAASEGYQQFAVVPKQLEEGEITGLVYLTVFPSAVTLDAEAITENGVATLTGSARYIDFDRLNASEESGAYQDPRGSAAPGRTVSARIEEVTYIQTQTGEYYDFISKRVVPQYSYSESAATIADLTATTDASGGFTLAWPVDETKGYRAYVTIADDAGRQYLTTVYAYQAQQFYGYPGGVYLEDETFDQPSQTPYYYGYYGELAYATGEDVRLRLRGREDLPAGGTNRYLFYKAQNGIREYAVETDPRYAFTFDEDDVPGVSVVGVRFTGQTFQETPFVRLIQFDPAERELTVDVQPDRERYEPGEEVKLRVRTTDPDGNGVAADVNLAAVDEAIFNIDPYYNQYGVYGSGVLSALYQPVGSGIVRTYGSHYYPSSPDTGGRGGDGGARRDFRDVALYQTVTTDGGGNAELTFTLPDNLTSWRVTATGISEGLLAGQSRTMVPVGLPFFVDAVINRDYLTSDRPIIRLRALGLELREGEEVRFEVEAPSLTDGKLEASGRAFEPVDLALPELREGRHELTITARAGERSDAVVRFIEVVPSRLLHTEATYQELIEGVALAGSDDGITTVLISDHNRGRYYPSLQQLSWTYGDRVDQRLARAIARELLRDEFDEEPPADDDFAPSSYQTPDGGIALFPYADDDLALSARIADLAPERIGGTRLRTYFELILTDDTETRERAIVALYGLAALGEPLLVDVRAAAAQSDLTWRERLYLGLAAAAAGDEDTARQIARGLLEEYGQRRGPWVRLNVPGDQDDIIEATALLAILAARAGEPLAADAFFYTRENYTKDILVELEQISYLRAVLPRLSSEPSTVEYTLDGERKRRTLERGESVALRLTPDQLDDLRPSVIEGAAGISTFYLAPLDPASVPADPAVGLTRLIENVAGGPIVEGSLVRITLTWTLAPQAVSGCYQVSDLAPSGLRPVMRPYAWDLQGLPGYLSNVTYPYAVVGQRTSFCVYANDPYKRPVVYYARVLGKGAYTAEPAIIQSQRAPESIALTTGEIIDIR